MLYQVPLASAPQLPEVDPQALEQLIAMGFDRDIAAQALQQNHNDVSAALTFLVWLTRLDSQLERTNPQSSLEPPQSHLFIQSTTDYHASQIEDFMDNFKSFYRDAKHVQDLKMEEWKLRNSYLYVPIKC